MRARDGLGQHRLADARHVLDQDMAAAHERDEVKLTSSLLADDDLLDIAADTLRNCANIYHWKTLSSGAGARPLRGGGGNKAPGPWGRAATTRITPRPGARILDRRHRARTYRADAKRTTRASPASMSGVIAGADGAMRPGRPGLVLSCARARDRAGRPQARRLTPAQKPARSARCRLD